MAIDQTVKFGLRGERVPRAEILAEFLSAHFQKNPTKSAYFDELCVDDDLNSDQNLHILMNYVLGVAKENSENAISDNLETPNVLNVLPSFRATAIYDEKFPAQK